MRETMRSKCSAFFERRYESYSGRKGAYGARAPSSGERRLRRGAGTRVVPGPENGRVVPSFSLVDVERSWVKPAPIRSIEQEAANEKSWDDSRASSGHVVTWVAAP